MLEARVGGFGKMILTNEVFKESYQLFIRYIAAVRLWEKSQIGNGAIGIEIYIEPQLDTFEIKIDIKGIIFNIHEKITPALIGLINIIMVKGH